MNAPAPELAGRRLLLAVHPEPSATLSAVIAVEHIAKRFGRVQALDDVSFRAGKGEVVGFLGENGAGKSTALRIVAGFLAPDAGRVAIDGVDVGDDPRAAQRRLGYLPEGAPLHDDMRVADWLAYRARLKGVSRARVGAALAAARATEAAGRRAGRLSRGWRQRVGLAEALLADPPVLVLDEPTTGLDPNQLSEARSLIGELARGRTVLLSTHLLTEVEAVCDRVVILAAGRVVAQGSVAELRAAEGRTRVSVAPDDLEAAREVLEAEVLDARAGRLAAALAPDEVARRLVAAGIGVVELSPARSLEDAFRALTRP
jgi:ABC-2 type transport system ATP-binding protein